MSDVQKPLKTSLSINDILVSVQLGVPPEERKTPQDVLISVEYEFLKIPDGVRTDDISNTLDYSKVSEAIESCIKNKSFQLLEHLSYHVWNSLPMFGGSKRSLVVKKVEVPLKNVFGGATFHISEM